MEKEMGKLRDQVKAIQTEKEPASAQANKLQTQVDVLCKEKHTVRTPNQQMTVLETSLRENLANLRYEKYAVDMKVNDLKQQLQ